MIQMIGDLIQRVTVSVKRHEVMPETPVVVRIGDFGVEMQIEHLKVQNTVGGPVLILQVMQRQ